MEEDKITFEYVENKVKNYITNPDDLALIKRAYEYANNVHKDEKRLNGEPYICHLLWVADILVDVKSDAQTICAGLLHDTLEYNPAMEDDLRQEFGDEITNLVVGV